MSFLSPFCMMHKDIFCDFCSSVVIIILQNDYSHYNQSMSVLAVDWVLIQSTSKECILSI